MTRASFTRRLASPPGFDPQPMLRFLASRAFAGVESVVPTRWTRMIVIGGTIAEVEVVPRSRWLAITLRGGNVRAADRIRERVADIFDLDAPMDALRSVLGRDRVLAEALARHGAMRIPSAWDPFELAVRAILGQQISVKAAQTLAARLVAACGRRVPAPLRHLAGEGLTHCFPVPVVLARADLGGLGIVGARARAINALARAAATQPELFARGRSLDAIVATFLRQPGIGPWTAQYVALRGFGEADAFPHGDLGLLAGYARLAGRTVTPSELDRIAERWRPYRGYAAMLLWSAH